MKKLVLVITILALVFGLCACTKAETPKAEDNKPQVEEPAVKDGKYSVEIEFAGGTGKAKILSPIDIEVKDGQITATLVWSSKNYDYMLVDGEKYISTTTEPGSTFVVPLKAMDEELQIVGDSVAMSTPHEIEYTIKLLSNTMKAK